MDAVAIVRPDDWNFALFVHVLGAMVMVGALVLALGYLVGAWRGQSPDSLRVGFRALLYGAVPAFVIMRGAGQWIYSNEALDELPSDPSWLGLGFSIADGGALLLLIATIVAGIGSRRVATADAPGGMGSVRVAAVLTGVLLAAYVVAIWAMTAKPA